MKRNTYRLTSRAIDDVSSIIDFIAQRSPQNALHVFDELSKAMEALAETPGLGHRREDVTDRPLLFWSVYSFLIVYRPDRKPLEIVRVLHGARNLPPIFDKE